jgi:hypothetical protein
LLRQGVDKLLKVLTIELAVFLLKMPTAQGFNHAIQPKCFTRLSNFHAGFDAFSTYNFGRLGFAPDARFILCQVAQLLNVQDGLELHQRETEVC